MKYFLLILFIISLTCSAYSKENTPTGKLMVYLYNFESDEGNVRVHLYNGETSQYFPTVSSKAYKVIIAPIHDKKALITFDNLPYGFYALAIHHDKNLNIKMENFLGMPAEGWGLSQNIIPIFHLPSFEDCQFDVNKPVNKIGIVIRN